MLLNLHILFYSDGFHKIIPTEIGNPSDTFGNHIILLRENILKLQQTGKQLNEDETNKKLRAAAETFISEARNIITEDFSKNKDILVDKDKYRQSLREAETLITKCDEEADNLETLLKDIVKKNSIFGKMNRWIEDILKEYPKWNLLHVV